MSIAGVCLEKPGTKVALTGNEAIARGALEAGVAYAASYPGSPTAEVLGTLSRLAGNFKLYAEWSVNEKVAMEGAAAASFAGLRSLVVMKADGLNVALDFAGALAISGCRGGMVIVLGDDPNAHSSVREEDSRNLCKAIHLPVLEPSSVQEALEMTREAFSLSEDLKLPVVVRCVTRVCHASGDVELGELNRPLPVPDFTRDNRVITFGIQLHALQEQKLARAAEWACHSGFNSYTGPENPERLVIACGPCYMHALEALDMLAATGVGVLKLGVTWPLPHQLLLKYLRNASEVVFAEEVEPFVEDNVTSLAAMQIPRGIKFYGKRSGHVAGPAGPGIGELDPDILASSLAGIFGVKYETPGVSGRAEALELLGEKMPDRELAFCAGCPHRASFWAVRAALELDGRGGIVLGDIGCYTLGMARTGYNLLQTVHCMGAGIGLAGGMANLSRFGFDRPIVTLVGDSTFYHAAIPALINARYHNSSFLCVVLDNETTAMTGHQPHPGRSVTAMGEPARTVRMEELLQGVGLPYVVQDPYDVEATIDVVCNMLGQEGPRVLILRRTCVLAAVRGKQKARVYVDQEKCIGDSCGCGRFCSRVFACPANVWDAAGGKARIDEAVCNGCGVCASLCPQGAIVVERAVL
ncbi:indolepyruvate oxidoreductase subunit IorA [Desulfocucumis palustris]|uniref:Indolepyruvate oxidoreductase subunit IorA n=1 Tax=Desulfocucumis palustris TaxID=1898651 RepID=A0A2L2XA87_9FIRM|nr:thiamine pyrophosphate-dependent enzyme [Desulfocucumis palustris]GBF32962.1 indolepyruvate oxidoreductase subunit IorA [Desulfocucumis palustris]